MQEKRKEWKGFAEKTDSKKLVFLDESGVNVNMTRPYGCSKGKSRVVDSVPLNKPTITTIISSIRLDGKIVHTAFQGAITGDLLKKYLSDILLPTLHAGDIVIMDNLHSHRVK